MCQKYRALGLCLAFAGALALGSCSKSYDDSALQGRITNVEGRVTQIENQLKTMNTNISSLQAMVEALKSNTPISAVTPVANNGYQLTFSGGKSITIYPDASGRVDSSRPTPRFKIENDYWFVSYDNAQSWERLSRAKGDQGERGVPGLQGERGIAGERGANGHTPVIGMERGSDGQYYWTVDGRRLQSSGGTAVTAVTTPRFKIENNRWYISYDNGSSWVDLGQAKGDKGDTGAPGRDGITPIFKIENDYWHVSYNNGSSWTQLGKAKGDKGDRGETGAAGTNSSNEANSVGAVFRTVTEDNSAVHVTLASGDRLSIPKVGGISINFDQSASIAVTPNNTYIIGYTLSGQTIGSKSNVQAIAQDGYRVEVKRLTDKTGQIFVHSPSRVVKTTIVLLASDGVSQTITSALVVGSSESLGAEANTGGSSGGGTQGGGGNASENSLSVLRLLSSVFTLPKEGGTAEAVVYTNTSYRTSIPTEAQSWVQLLPNEGRAVIRKETLRFKVADNSTGSARSAVISLVDASGSIQESLMIYQGGVEAQTYHVATAGTLDQVINSADKATLTSVKITGCLNAFDYEFIKTMPRLRNLDILDISNTTIPASAFEGSNLTEVQLPTGLTAIPNRLFYASGLVAIEIPAGVQSIGEFAFTATSALRGSVVMPPALRTIGDYAFASSGLDGLVVLNEGLESIGNSSFAGVKLAGNIVIPNTVTRVGHEAFMGAQVVGDVIIGNGVVSIGDRAFWQFKSNGVLKMGTGVKTIGNGAFAQTRITISHIGVNVDYIGDSAFYEAKFQHNLIIPDGVEIIPSSAFYNVTIPLGLLVIGSRVKSIGALSFARISGLRKVWLKGTVAPSLHAIPLNDVHLSLAPSEYSFKDSPHTYLGVPIHSLGEYRHKNPWRYFDTIEEVEF